MSFRTRGAQTKGHHNPPQAPNRPMRSGVSNGLRCDGKVGSYRSPKLLLLNRPKGTVGADTRPTIAPHHALLSCRGGRPTHGAIAYFMGSAAQGIATHPSRWGKLRRYRGASWIGRCQKVHGRVVELGKPITCAAERARRRGGTPWGRVMHMRTQVAITHHQLAIDCALRGICP